MPSEDEGFLVGTNGNMVELRYDFATCLLYIRLQYSRVVLTDGTLVTKNILNSVQNPLLDKVVSVHQELSDVQILPGTRFIMNGLGYKVLEYNTEQVRVQRMCATDGISNSLNVLPVSELISMSKMKKLLMESLR